MLFLNRRFLGRSGLLLIALILLSAAFAAAAFAPSAQDPPPATCLEDAAGERLQCTANDVRVARYLLVEGPTQCTPGEVVRVKLQVELVSTAQDRYDIGLFVAQDGGNARTGTCYRDYLAPPLAPDDQYDPGVAFTLPQAGEQPAYTGGGPFLTAEDPADLCGDIGEGIPAFRDLGEQPSGANTGPVWVDVMCQDTVDAVGNPTPDEIADLGTCVSWDNQANASPVCTSVEAALPGTGAKCDCSYVQIAGLTVPRSAYLEIVKVLVPPTGPASFELLIDGVVRSGDAGVGDGGTTGRVELSVGTSTAPGADHTFAEAIHPGAEASLDDYDITVSCAPRGESAPAATGAGAGTFALRFMPGDDIVCTFTNTDIRPRLKLIKTVENPYGGTAAAANFQASVSAGGASTNVAWDSFITLPAGTYEVSEMVLPGYTASEWSGDCAADGRITLAVRDEKTCYITNRENERPPGEEKTVCVDGYVINHREQPVDGTRTVPELAVQAVRGDDPSADLGTAPVGADGYFKFANLPADTPVRFQLELPPDWEGIVPEVSFGGVAVSGPTTFPESTTCHRILFKIRRLVELPVYKWEDRLDGTVQPGGDWVITATPVDDPFTRPVEVSTAADGRVYLPLTPGNWTIAETLKPGWTPLTPQVLERFIDPYGPVGDGVVFKNRQPVCYPQIVVTKYGYGTNATGGRVELGPLAGWTFTLRRTGFDFFMMTETTGGDGRAVFDTLLPGEYMVTETEQPGWKVTSDNPVTVEISNCATANVRFENEELIGSIGISGRKLFKAWEKPYQSTLVGLSGWKITATLVGTDRSITAVTDALGEYSFTQDALRAAGIGFPGATIEVCEEQREHWIPVTPACVTVSVPYPLPPTYTGARVDFVNIQDPPK